MGFAQQRIPELLSFAVPEFPEGNARITRVDSVEGDCVINIRKQKKMLNYEMKVTASWEGELTVGEEKKKAYGKVKLPYICEDVEGLNFAVEVTVEGSEPHHRALKERVESIIPQVRERIQGFIAELGTR